MILEEKWARYSQGTIAVLIYAAWALDSETTVWIKKKVSAKERAREGQWPEMDSHAGTCTVVPGGTPILDAKICITTACLQFLHCLLKLQMVL